MQSSGKTNVLADCFPTAAEVMVRVATFVLTWSFWDCRHQRDFWWNLCSWTAMTSPPLPHDPPPQNLSLNPLDWCRPDTGKQVSGSKGETRAKNRIKRKVKYCHSVRRIGWWNMNVKWQLAQVVMFVCGVSVAAKGGCSIYSRGKKHTCMSSQGCRDVNTLRLHLWLKPWNQCQKIHTFLSVYWTFWQFHKKE